MPTRHHDVLDLDALGHQLGFDHSTMHDDLTPRLRCTACGSRDIGLIMRPQTGPTHKPQFNSTKQPGAFGADVGRYWLAPILAICLAIRSVC